MKFKNFLSKVKSAFKSFGSKTASFFKSLGKRIAAFFKALGPKTVAIAKAAGPKFIELSKKPGVALGTLNADTSISFTNNQFIGTQAGDQGNYKYETDTDVNTFAFVDENNVQTWINPQNAYILPTGKEKVVKIVFEGNTQVWDLKNPDNSMEIHTYKKIGTAIMTYHNWGIYQNTGIANNSYDPYGF